MTALERYERLESDGLWRAAPGAQRRDVTVSFGDATLVLTDRAGRPLAHWSMPALVRLDAGALPALYAPDPEGSETLEIDDSLMVDAIEEVRAALARAVPRQGRLRVRLGLALAAFLAVVAVVWLPGALERQALAMVPAAKRVEIGEAILARIEAQTGPLCRDRQGQSAARALAARVTGGEAALRVAVLPRFAAGAEMLPGRIALLDARLLREADDPAVPAGFLLMAREQAVAGDPLAPVIARAGLRGTLRLLVTGDLPPEALSAAAEAVLANTLPRAPEGLSDRFAAAGLPFAPFARAAAARGLTLPEAEAEAVEIGLILGDDAWVSLQNICTG